MLDTQPMHLRGVRGEQALERRMAHLRRELVRDDTIGHFRHERAPYLLQAQDTRTPAQQRILAWLRDYIHPGLPRAWYRLVLGHDLHISVFAELYAVHFHATEPDPFTGRLGWF